MPRRSIKRKPDLRRDLEFLLRDLCRWGFCNRLTAEDLIASETPLSATAFARAVLQAEKMIPEYEAKWMREIETQFIARFGQSVSPESYAMTVSEID